MVASTRTYNIVITKESKEIKMSNTLYKKTDDELLSIFEPLMENLLQGSTERDHQKHTKDFTQRIRNLVSKEKLERMCSEYQKKLGYFTKREFLYLFRRKDSVAVIWRLFFTKSDDEFVLEAVFIENNGRIMIDHCMIF